jgi:hypothetical protein
VINVEPGQLLSQAAFASTKEVWCSVELTDVSVPLVVIPTTAKPEQECEFRLRFESSEVVTVAPVDPELQYRMYTQAGKWEGASAGGCKNYPATVCNNPQYSLELEKATTVTVTLSQTAKDPFAPIGLYICKSKGPMCSIANRLLISCFSAGSKISSTTAELGPGLSPVVRPKNGGGSRKDGQKAARLKSISSKQIVIKSEFQSCKEASVSFKVASLLVSFSRSYFKSGGAKVRVHYCAVHV